jgi:hypothetical protein
MRQVSQLARHFGKSPDLLGQEEIRSYQIYLTQEKKLTPGSVTIAYDVIQENGIGQRMRQVLMRGLSTRQYAEVLPEMALACGVSKSTVGRAAAEAGESAAGTTGVTL